MRKPRLTHLVMDGLLTMMSVAEAGDCADFLGHAGDCGDGCEDCRDSRTWENVLKACEWIVRMSNARENRAALQGKE